MPRPANVRRNATRKAVVIAGAAPGGPDLVGLAGDNGRGVTGALVEFADPFRSAFDGESLRVRPDVLAAHHPVVLVGCIRGDRRDEPGGVLRRRYVEDGGDAAVRPSAVGDLPEIERWVLGEDVAAVVRVHDDLAAVAARVRTHLAGGVLGKQQRGAVVLQAAGDRDAVRHAADADAVVLQGAQVGVEALPLRAVSVR